VPPLGSVAWQKPNPWRLLSGPQDRRTEGINGVTLFKCYEPGAPLILESRGLFKLISAEGLAPERTEMPRLEERPVPDGSPLLL